MHAESPGDAPAVIPMGAYQGNPPVPPVDTPTIATERMLMARSDADGDAVFAITKTLMEDRQEIGNAISDENKSVRILVGEVRQPPMRTGLGPPVHPAALAYYDRDHVSYLAEHADIECLILAAFVLLWLWISELRRSGGLRQKAQGDNYNRKMVDLMAEARTAISEQNLALIDKQLTGMMATAIQDLDQDTLSGMSFQSFHTVWQVTSDVVKERRLALAKAAAPPGLPVPAAKPRFSMATMLRQKTG
jgi:hypothetical protein